MWGAAFGLAGGPRWPLRGVPMPPASALLVVAVLCCPSPLKPPVDLVRLRVPPLAHPVLEPRQQHDRDRVRGGRCNRTHHDLGVERDERGLGWDWCGDDLHRVCIRARHEADCNSTRVSGVTQSRFGTPIETL